MKQIRKIKSFFAGLKLKYKFLMSTYLIVLFSLLLFFVTVALIASTYIKKTTLTNAMQSYELSKTILEEKLETINMWSLALTQEPQMYAILSSGLDLDNTVNAANSVQFIESYMNAVQCPDISHISVYLRTNSELNTNYIIDFSFAENKQWYAKMIYNNDFAYWNPIPETAANSDDADAVYSLIRLVRDPLDNYKPVAVVKVDFKKSIIDDILKKNNKYTDCLCYLQSKYGDLYAANDPDAAKVFYTESWSNDTFVFSSESWTDCRIDNQKYYFINQNLEGSTFSLSMAVPSFTLSDLMDSFTPWLLVALLLTLIVAYIISARVSKSVTGRILLLADNLRHVREGQIVQLSEEDNCDDVGLMINTCNEMILKINTLMHESYENGINFKKAEYQILTEQIKPHFLYNTLNLIQYLSTENKNDKIIDVVQSLSQFYKTGLSDGKTEILLRDELQHIQSYVNIINIRYSDKIKLSIDASSEHQSCRIIKTILQPIVENSISHGILGRLSGTGSIRIRVYDDLANPDDMIIEIFDDGIGIKPTRLNELDTQDSGGIGLGNTDLRIKLHYGEEYGLDISSVYGEHTVVKIKLPKIF